MAKRNFRTHRPLFSSASPKALREPKFKWKLLPILWLGLKRTAMALGFLVLLNIFVALFIVPLLLPSPKAAPSLPNEMVLFLPLEDGLDETPPPANFRDPFAPTRPTLRDLVDGIDRAALDDRVKGIVARMYDGNFDLSKSAELRAALTRFRQAGKFAHIYANSYGEGGGGMGRYALATAFDEIWMQPLGVVSITGIQADVPFFRGVLDKIGVRPQFFQRKDYKTAYESITNENISPENREMMQRLIGDMRSEILNIVPPARGMSADEFDALVDKGLFTAEAAKAAKLIDHADYGDVLLDNVAEAVTGERDADALEIVNIGSYANFIRKKSKSQSILPGAKPKVALVYAVGAIMPSAGQGGLGSDMVAPADEIAPAILAAAKDENVSAIVLRIDSPGGSPSASESILRAVEKAQEEGKPVIVSMGATAASGGYWIAAYADKIYALPTTLTGSIGVVGGKFSVAELAGKVGVNWAEINWGENAGLWSSVSSFSESEAAQFNLMLDNVYDNFVARVAKGRDMSVTEVDAVAGGRVWSGARAVDAGLVDALGGLNDALAHVAEISDVEGVQDLNVVVYPKPKTPFERVLELLETQVTIGRGLRVQQGMLDAFSPAISALDAVKNPQNYSVYEPLRLK